MSDSFSIKHLLQKEADGEALSEKEKKYLQNYKHSKQFRHSQSFITHAKSLPEEDEHEKTD